MVGIYDLTALNCYLGLLNITIFERLLINEIGILIENFLSKNIAEKCKK